MSLLTNVMDHSLDDGYAEAAARKQAEGAGGMPKTVRAKLGLAVGLVLAALVVTVGAANARIAAPVVAKEREELIDRIERETDAADKLESSVDTLRDDVSARQRQALKKDGGGQADLVEILSGATEVHGPGVKLVVNDAKDPAPVVTAIRGRPPVSPTPGGSATVICSASSTGSGSRAPRPSRSTGSG